MSRYDGLIIPRSYSEYINKTDAATLQQALQLSGVLSGAVAAGDNKAVKSSAVNNALAELATKTDLKTFIKKNEYTGWTSGAEKSVITPDVNRPQILMLCGSSEKGDVQTYALGIRTVNSNAAANNKNYITWIKEPPSNIVFTLNLTDLTKIKIDYTGNYSLHLYLWT